MGQSGHNPPSRFLKDLPADLLHQANRSGRSEYERAARSAPVAAQPGGFSPGPWAAAAQPAHTNGGGSSFHAGDHVRHARFGEGIVVAAKPTASGTDQEVTVAFKGEAGVKKILLSFGPLEKLD
jgi:DNA helicase-2/ATP-dependent DNA helicase PcrA